MSFYVKNVEVINTRSLILADVFTQYNTQQLHTSNMLKFTVHSGRQLSILPDTGQLSKFSALHKLQNRDTRCVVAQLWNSAALLLLQ